jgi:signal transduction histidine kinase
LFGYYLTYQNCINVEKEKVKSLVTDISHQIRTPLASIKIYNSLLIDGGLTQGEEEVLLGVDNNNVKIIIG